MHRLPRPRSPNRRPRSRRPSCRRNVPTETEDPDRVVTPNDSKKPKEDDAENRRGADRRPPEELVAAEATAMPSSEAVPEGTRSVAPVQGTGKDAAAPDGDLGSKELSAHFDRHKRYPEVQKFKKTTGRGQLWRSTGWAMWSRPRSQGFGRSGLRRGGARDGATVRSGAAASAGGRRPSSSNYTLPVIFKEPKRIELTAAV